MITRAPVRLALCLDNLQIGGTELNAVRWAEQLPRDRFQLTVVVFQADGPLRERFVRTGAKVVHLPLESLYGAGAVRLGARFARLLRRERIQILHTQDIYSNIFGVPWARLARVPAVVASRRWWHLNPRPIHRIANRWAYRGAHRVLANTPSIATMLTREEGIPASKVVCVPNFLAEDSFQPLPAAERTAWRARMGLPADAFAIGIVARLVGVKDHATLLRAMARVRAEVHNAHLVCAGDGPLRAELQSLAAELGLEKHVHFPGTVTLPFSLHHLLDVSVLCSVTEGLPNSILEAMAAGRPVVATRVGGVPDAIQDGTTGVLVPPSNPDALAAALLSLIRAPDRARALGAAALSYARAEYHETRVIDRLTTWYESLAWRAPAAG